MKLGLFGGTFDPIHLGHLFVAQRALEIYQLDKVIFIPANDPPNKKDNVVTIFDHRINMIKLAIQDNENFIVDDIEYENDISYSIDTIRDYRFIHQYDDLYLILGDDEYEELVVKESWKNSDEILKLIIPVRFNRDDMSSTEIRNMFNYKIKAQKYWLHPTTYLYIKENNLYGNS